MTPIDVQQLSGTTLCKEASEPRVTVITVVFNSAELLEETIRSVVNQTYGNIEYIVIDGASTDGSVEIITKYKEAIDFWISEPDSGIYDAMNKGVLHAKDGWTIFMNAGDRFVCQTAIEKMMREMVGSPDVVYGDVQILRNGQADRVIRAKKMRLPLLVMPACHQSMMVKTALLKRYPYDTGFSLAADFDNLCRIVANGGLVQQIPHVIALVSAGGVSDTDRDMVYRQYELISARHFGKRKMTGMFYARHRIWERIKLRIKKVAGTVSR